MQIVKVNLGEDHFINLSGDWHKGTKLHDAGAVEQTIEDTLQPDTFFIGMGDLVEAITVDDKRYESKLHKKTVIEQYDDVEEIVKRIKSKTILHLMGNHDWTLSRRYGDMVESMCKSLKVKYGDYSSVICVYADPGYPISPRDNKDLELEYLLYKIYVNHGFGSIQSRIDSTSERKHSVDRSLRRKLFMKFDDCRVMAMGHTHRLVIIPPSDSLGLHVDQDGPKGKEIHSHYAGLAVSENGYIPPEGRWYVNTGGYLRMYGEGVTGYAEVKGYDPIEIGYAKIICKGSEIKNIERVVLG